MWTAASVFMGGLIMEQIISLYKVCSTHGNVHLRIPIFSFHSMSYRLSGSTPSCEPNFPEKGTSERLSRAHDRMLTP